MISTAQNIRLLLLCLLGATSVQAAEIDEQKVTDLLTGATPLSTSPIAVGQGSCATTVDTVMQTSAGLLLSIRKPRDCAFRHLELLINNETMPLAVLRGAVKRSGGDFVWAPSAHTIDGLFETRARFSAADVKTLRLREPYCRSATDCLNSANVNQAAGNPVDSGTQAPPPDSIAACKNAAVPNPNPLPQESTEFYGECKDGKAITGVILWKQAGAGSYYSCVVDGRLSDDIFGNNSHDYRKGACTKFLRYTPDYCSTPVWDGQCKNGKPEGVGVLQWSNGNFFNLNKSNYAYTGSVRDGKPNGYGLKRTFRDCGPAGCAGDTSTEAGWWSNGALVMSCAGGPLGCKAAIGAQEKYKAARKLEKALECEEALNMDRSAQKADAQKHTAAHHEDGFEISYSDCVSERKFSATLNTRDPQAMYLAAGAYSRNGENSRASRIYEKLIERFPSSSWAVKANDQLNADKRQRDADMAARQRQGDARRARESAARQERTQCSIRIGRCQDSCSPLRGAAWSSCRDRCESLCSSF